MNRKKVIKMLIGVTNNNKNKRYIFTDRLHGAFISLETAYSSKS